MLIKANFWPTPIGTILWPISIDDVVWLTLTKFVCG